MLTLLRQTHTDPNGSSGVLLAVVDDVVSELHSSSPFIVTELWVDPN